MSRALSIFCACALIFAAVVAQEVQEEVPVEEETVVQNDNGFSLLVARRTFLNDSFVENREMSVRIQIWNLGTKFVISLKSFISQDCLSNIFSLLFLFHRDALNVVIEEPYPDMFTKVEKKVYEKITAFVFS